MGIGYYNKERTILMMNKIGASQLNGKPEDFVGKTIYDITKQKLAEKLMERISLAAISTDSQVYEDHFNNLEMKNGIYSRSQELKILMEK
jgi:hypothetical protein